MSLRVKITLVIAGIGFTLGALFLFVWIPRAAENSQRILEIQTQGKLAITGEVLLPHLLQNEYADVYESLDALLKTNPDWVTIELRDDVGSVIYPLTPPAASNGNGHRTLAHDIKLRGQHLGTLVLTADFSEPLVTLREQTFELFLLFVFGLFFGLAAIIVLLDRLVRRPAEKLSYASARLAKGDYSVSLPEPSKDEIGNLATNFKMMRDAIREKEVALRESDERYELAVRHAAIWDWDINADKVYFSPKFRESLGYTNAEFREIKKNSIRQIIHPDDIKSYDAQLAAHLANPNSSFIHEHRFRKKSNDYRWFLARGQCICDADGKPFRSTGLLTDITDRKHAETLLLEAKEAADQANLAKSQFLATMSHELRTPLNAIMGFSDMMTQETFGPLGASQYEGYVIDIHKSGGHLLAMIEDILEMSKVEAGKIDLHRELIAIAPLVSDAFIYVKGKSEEKGVSVVNDVLPDLPLFFGDKRAILQVLINLVVNGLKFTPKGGSVTVTAEESAGQLKILVTDTGIGIAPENIPVAWEPFSQVAREHQVKQEGTGLGLSLSKSLVELHSGTLSLESEVGKGTVVTMVLPVTSRIGWYPSMSVGVEVFDSDHRKLMALIDQVVTAVRSGEVDGVVHSMATRLTAYSEIHFRAEEEVMDALGFPGAKGHKATHDAFRRWLGELKGELGSRSDEKLVAEISEYLGNWLVDHILQVDGAYNKYFEQRPDDVSRLLVDYEGVPQGPD